MIWKSVVAALITFTVMTSPSWAQYQRGPQYGWGFQEQTHRIEISGYGGYSWTSSLDVRFQNQIGEADIKSGPSWGIEIDINVKPGGQLALLYHRQDSELTFRPNTGGLKQTVGDVAVEYWHIGGVGGVQRGNVMPFSMVTIGATRLIPKFRGAVGDEWRFSMILGIGAKVYLGEYLGLRLQARLPWVILDGGAAISCGAGGCYTAIGGSGVVQPDVGAGLFLMF